MKIAILGTGSVGTALGARLGQSGHQVSYGSRNPAEHQGAVSQREAVETAEIVITAIPGTAVLSTLESIGEDALGDRIVLDPSVAVTPEMTLAYPNDSLARHIQERFPRARVVKTLNTMNVSIMIDPLTKLSQATVFLSGDDAARRQPGRPRCPRRWPLRPMPSAQRLFMPARVVERFPVVRGFQLIQAIIRDSCHHQLILAGSAGEMDSLPAAVREQELAVANPDNVQLSFCPHATSLFSRHFRRADMRLIQPGKRSLVEGGPVFSRKRPASSSTVNPISLCRPSCASPAGEPLAKGSYRCGPAVALLPGISVPAA
jgi:hypothetical protein